MVRARGYAAVLAAVLAAGRLAGGEAVTEKPPAEVKAESEAERKLKANCEEVAKLLALGGEAAKGKLPDTFRVTISLHAHGRLDERYLFTPTKLCLLCPVVTKVEVDAFGTSRPQYARDADGKSAYYVAQEHSFSRMDEVCRILLALDYVNLVSKPDPQATPDNLYVMRVMGLGPFGSTSISVGVDERSVECGENCLFYGFNSTQSIRYAALYHTLRQLARTELEGTWRPAAVDAAEVEKNASNSTKRKNERKQGEAKTGE